MNCLIPPFTHFFFLSLVTTHVSFQFYSSSGIRYRKQERGCCAYAWSESNTGSSASVASSTEFHRLPAALSRIRTSSESNSAVKASRSRRKTVIFSWAIEIARRVSLTAVLSLLSGFTFRRKNLRTKQLNSTNGRADAGKNVSGVLTKSINNTSSIFFKMHKIFYVLNNWSYDFREIGTPLQQKTYSASATDVDCSSVRENRRRRHVKKKKNAIRVLVEYVEGDFGGSTTPAKIYLRWSITIFLN